MATVIITLKAMPEGVEVDLDKLTKELEEKISKFIGGTEVKVNVVEVAFGLKSLEFLFAMDEDQKIDDLEEELKQVQDVQSIEVTDVRRSIG